MFCTEAWGAKLPEKVETCHVALRMFSTTVTLLCSLRRIPNECVESFPNFVATFVRGAEGTDLVEYYVECDLVARALDDNDRIRCIQKISHIQPGKQRFLANMPSFTVASFNILIAIHCFLKISELSHMDYPDTAFELDQV